MEEPNKTETVEQAAGQALDQREQYAARLVGFHRFYRFLVIGCAAFCAAAVVIAVYVRVWIGLAVAIAIAFLYRYLLKDELKKQLGFFCRRVDDGLALGIRGTPTVDGELWIPGRLLWLDVTEWTGERAEGTDLSDVRVLHFHAGLRRIGERGFEGMDALETVWFTGTEEEWNGLEKPSLPETVTLLFEARTDVPRTKKQKTR